MIIQLTGLSGSGKSTLSFRVKNILEARGFRVEVIDGDEYRKELCADLGFSRADRNTNIRRLAFVASKLSKNGIIAIICAINPYEDVRKEISLRYNNVKTVYISCALPTLIGRDTKGLYQRAFLANDHPDKVNNLTGVNDPFDIPDSPDLTIDTDDENEFVCAEMLAEFIAACL